MSVTFFANIFSHSVGYLFILFMVSFAVQKLVSLVSYYFFLLLLFLLHCLFFFNLIFIQQESIAIESNTIQIWKVLTVLISIGLEKLRLEAERPSNLVNKKSWNAELIRKQYGFRNGCGRLQKHFKDKMGRAPWLAIWVNTA